MGRALLLALPLLLLTPRKLEAQQTVRVPLGFVTSAARDTLTADWSDDPRAPERAYCVDTDSVPQDWSPGYQVVYVTRVHRVSDPMATPMTTALDCHGRPAIHSHGGYCVVDQWGVEPETCSSARPEADQCQPSIPDLSLLLKGGEDYDVIQCGRTQFVFVWRTIYLNFLGGEHGTNPSEDRRGERAGVPRVRRAVR